MNNINMNDPNAITNNNYGNRLPNASQHNNQFGQSSNQINMVQQALTNPQLAKSAKTLLQSNFNNSMNHGSGSQAVIEGPRNMNMGASNMSMNMNASAPNSNFTNGNNCNSYSIAAPNNNASSGGQDDNMNWLKQALQNPQLASSAKFLLQTTDYINNCTSSSGNRMCNNNVINATGNSNTQPGPLNTSQVHVQNHQNQMQGERLQGNFTSNSSSMNNTSLPQISRDASSVTSQNRMMSPMRQGAHSVLSTSSQSTGQYAGMANVQGNTTLMYNANAMLPQCGHILQQQNQQCNNFQQQQQQQQLQQSIHGMNSFQQQIMVNQMPTQNQQQLFMNQAANFQQQQQQQQKQQYLMSQTFAQPQHNQNQGPNTISANFNNVSYANGNQKTKNGIINQHFKPSSDDLNNIEPADYREDASDDLDLSFLLDDASSDDGIAKSMANPSQTRATPAPAQNAASAHSIPAGNQPGSSQQMQEHLREIAKQNLPKFEMSHPKRQKKKKKVRKTSHGEDNSNDQGQNVRAVGEPATKTERPCINTENNQPANLGCANVDTNPTSSRNNMQPSATHSHAQTGSLNSQIALSQNNIACSSDQDNLNSAFSSADGIRHQYLASVGGGMKRKRDAPTQAHSSRLPEMKRLYEYVESMLSSKGYSLTKLPAKDLGYITQPSPLQAASFGFAVCSSIKKGGAGRLSALLSSGLSPNPVNKFGDSPFFLACKRGLPDIIKAFLDHGTDVRVADGFGRTALHYVAWSNDPCFASAKLLLNADARLICVMDNHGNTPLDFVGDSNK